MVPTTGAPPTVAPLTAAPAPPPTFTPPAAPQTFAPASQTDGPAVVLTFVPSTTPPSTVPPTAVPVHTAGPVSSSGSPSGSPAADETVAPSTGAPTASPDLGATEEEDEGDGTMPVVTKTVTDATTVGSFISLTTLGMAAAPMSTLSMMTLSCQEEGDRKLPLVLHPLQFQIDGSNALGCVVGNTALMIGFYCGTYGIYRLVSVVRPLLPAKLPADLRGFVRFPSMTLFIVIWLYQGAALSSIILILHAPSTGSWLLGVGVGVLCVILPMWVFHRVVDGTRWRKMARYRYDRQPIHPWLECVIGPGEWVSTSPEKLWVWRYSAIVLTYRQETAWWALLEFLAAFTLAAITAVPTSDHVQCGHIKLTCALVFCVLLFLEVRFSPHVRWRDNCIDPLTLLSTAGSMFFAAVALYADNPEHWTGLATRILILMATGLIILKALLDLATEGYLLFNGRRERLQKEEWGQTEKDAAFAPCDLGCEHRSQKSCEPTEDGAGLGERQRSSSLWLAEVENSRSSKGSGSFDHRHVSRNLNLTPLETSFLDSHAPAPRNPGQSERKKSLALLSPVTPSFHGHGFSSATPGSDSLSRMTSPSDLHLPLSPNARGQVPSMRRKSPSAWSKHGDLSLSGDLSLPDALLPYEARRSSMPSSNQRTPLSLSFGEADRTPLDPALSSHSLPRDDEHTPPRRRIASVVPAAASLSFGKAAAGGGAARSSLHQAKPAAAVLSPRVRAINPDQAASFF
ncbi:hypothetical protein DIPPA_16870 [Diplonema papillatum]|nr:hypothetical protein DIPPA_25934 [Diplonema papillatum]KAJ9458697.1 hypothetical protein DIPPA_16870 [Diplonema papillatum]